MPKDGHPPGLADDNVNPLGDDDAAKVGTLGLHEKVLSLFSGLGIKKKKEKVII